MMSSPAEEVASCSTMVQLETLVVTCRAGAGETSGAGKVAEVEAGGDVEAGAEAGPAP